MKDTFWYIVLAANSITADVFLTAVKIYKSLVKEQHLWMLTSCICWTAGRVLDSMYLLLLRIFLSVTGPGKSKLLKWLKSQYHFGTESQNPFESLKIPLRRAYTSELNNSFCCKDPWDTNIKLVHWFKLWFTKARGKAERFFFSLLLLYNTY